MKRRRALIVEDDERIVSIVEDTLCSLGHDFESATNQSDAEAKLQASPVDYVLLDLQIPARPNRGGASPEYGLNLLRRMRELPNLPHLPVIIMTGAHRACVDLANELKHLGASDFISKPFPDQGRTLAVVIRDVLGDGRVRRTGKAPAQSLLPFPGGKMLFAANQITLLGEVIAESSEKANYWAVLQRLKQRRPDGRYIPARGTELARLFRGGRASQNTVSSSVGDLRNRIIEAMAAAGYACGKEDVILSGGAGYRLNQVIEVVESGGDIAGTLQGQNVSGNGHVPARKVDVPANDRQRWALEVIRREARLQREQVEKQFDVSSKTAKRDLADLVEAGIIEFVRTPRPGHYRLAKR